MQRMEARTRKKRKRICIEDFQFQEKEQEKIREWELKHDAEKHGLKTFLNREQWGMVA